MFQRPGYINILTTIALPPSFPIAKLSYEIVVVVEGNDIVFDGVRYRGNF